MTCTLHALSRLLVLLCVCAVCVAPSRPASADPVELHGDDALQGDASTAAPRPFVREGIEDKPYLTDAFGTLLGGYGDIHFRYEESEGATEALTFVPKRFNFFTFTSIGERVRVATELEIEEAGEEIKLELAVIDFEIDPALIFRAGIILAPLGRFNLAHDAPANDLTDRPLVSTQLLGATLSEVGMGFYGAFFPYEEGRITYEIYAVNGLTDGVLVGSDEGTRVPAGKDNFEDADHIPSGVARIAFSPVALFELGLSAHVGPYNRIEADGLTFDERRLLAIAALDWDVRWWLFELVGEYAWVHVELPASLGDLFASQQQGVYVELAVHLFEGVIEALPESVFTLAGRFDFVDFDMAVDGDSVLRATGGVNFRPQEATVFKLDGFHQWSDDAFAVETQQAGVLFSVASYF